MATELVYLTDFDIVQCTARVTSSQETQDEQIANQLDKSGTDNTLRFMPVKEMPTICRHVPENIPKNKPARVVIYGDNFGIPCGGTHVKNLKQIGTVTVPKLKEKKGILRVNYTVEGIN